MLAREMGVARVLGDEVMGARGGVDAIFSPQCNIVSQIQIRHHIQIECMVPMHL